MVAVEASRSERLTLYGSCHVSRMMLVATKVEEAYDDSDDASEATAQDCSNSCLKNQHWPHVARTPELDVFQQSYLPLPLAQERVTPLASRAKGVCLGH
jgi:hypothetical protein